MSNNYNVPTDTPKDPVKKPDVPTDTDPTLPESAPDPPKSVPITDPIPATDGKPQPVRDPGAGVGPNVVPE
jgi:hypothetical protein